RLDRLHQRVDAASAALDRQLRRRCDVAKTYRSLAEKAGASAGTIGLGHDRELVENALSRAIERVSPDGALADEAAKTTYARSFFNDTVRDALVVRRRRIVRWFRLAGSAPMPSFFEMDDVSVARRTIDV